MVIARVLATEGAWDRKEIESLLDLVEPDSRVLVVGAHVGSLVIPLAKRAREVVAYEANPGNFSLLLLNLKLNDVTNVVARNSAAMDGPGALRMLANTTNTGSSKVVPRQTSYAYIYDKPQEIEIAGVAIDEDIEDRRFDLVVVDIEGSEPLALKGMTQVLRNAKFLQIEYLPHLVRDVTGATDQDFLAPLSANFDFGRVAGQQLEFDRSKFAELLAHAAKLGGADLVFRRLAPAVR